MAEKSISKRETVRHAVTKRLFDQDILGLRIIDRLTHSEIARRLNCSPAKVGERLREFGLGSQGVKTLGAHGDDASKFWTFAEFKILSALAQADLSKISPYQLTVMAGIARDKVNSLRSASALGGISALIVNVHAAVTGQAAPAGPPQATINIEAQPEPAKKLTAPLPKGT